MKEKIKQWVLTLDFVIAACKRAYNEGKADCAKTHKKCKCEEPKECVTPVKEETKKPKRKYNKRKKAE